MSYLLLIIGFIIIIKASDILVSEASQLAVHMGIPKILIALTIVAFGTCAPEFAISFNSIASQNSTIALANVIGSIIVNTLLIIGLAAIINPIVVKNNTIKKELPMLVFITLSFSCLVLDKTINKDKSNFLSRSDGILLLILFSIFIFYIIQMVRKRKTNVDDTQIEEKKQMKRNSVLKSVLLTIISIIFIIYSSNLIVDSALKIAMDLGVSEKIVTLIGIVIGTSLPELGITITSAKKSEFEMTIGNIIGTNIFNICIVLGLPIAVFGKLEVIDFNYIDMIFVFLSSFLLFVFARSEKRINKLEGGIMLLTFVIYYIYALY